MIILFGSCTSSLVPPGMRSSTYRLLKISSISTGYFSVRFYGYNLTIHAHKNGEWTKRNSTLCEPQDFINGRVLVLDSGGNLVHPCLQVFCLPERSLAWCWLLKCLALGDHAQVQVKSDLWTLIQQWIIFTWHKADCLNTILKFNRSCFLFQRFMQVIKYSLVRLFNNSFNYPFAWCGCTCLSCLAFSYYLPD